VHGNELSAEDALSHKKARHTGPTTDIVCEIGGNNVSDMKQCETEALLQVFAGDQADSAEPLAKLHSTPVETVPEEPHSKKARTMSSTIGAANLVPEAKEVEFKAGMARDEDVKAAEEPLTKKASFLCGGS